MTIDGIGITYDALGRMVEQNRSGVYEQIVYSPTGAKLARMNEASLVKAFIPMPGGSMSIYNASGLAYYRHPDWLGSSRFASTPARAMYFDGAYAPFGDPYVQTTDLSFTGMNQDTVSALYDFPAREYGIQGRWPSPDPAGLKAANLTDPQSWNRYAYVRNNPTSRIDPSGMVDINPGLLYGMMGGGGGFGCQEDGLDVSCESAYLALQGGGAVQCPNNNCGIGTATPYQCLEAACGYMSYQYAATHANEVDGQLLTDAQYNAYMVATHRDQVNGQYNRLSGYLAALFGGQVTADPNNPDIVGAHANFSLDCGDGPCPSPGRYDDGIHIECASGGYNCGFDDPLVVHDDTVSPWTGPFSFWSVFSGNFWEHGLVDLSWGSLCNCVFSQ